ncbi:MAG: hypothetical protein OXB92_06405, partial [Acidimicrobiaceae bacterium]|nr:hypothetical protein [Acidimicrobiaceae bacterium]
MAWAVRSRWLFKYSWLIKCARSYFELLIISVRLSLITKDRATSPVTPFEEQLWNLEVRIGGSPETDANIPNSRRSPDSLPDLLILEI